MDNQTHVHHYATGRSAGVAAAIGQQLTALRRTVNHEMPADTNSRTIDSALNEALETVDAVCRVYVDADKSAHAADVELRQRLSDIEAVERAAARGQESV